MESVPQTAYPTGPESDPRVEGWRRRRRIAWGVAAALFLLPSVLSMFQLKMVGAVAFLLSMDMLMAVVAVLYAASLGARIRSAQSSRGTLFGQILPPLLLLPLFVLPWDAMLVYWLVGGAATLMALFNLATKLSGPGKRPWVWMQNLRSVLTVVFFLAALATAVAVEVAARRYTDELAADFQHACKVAGKCPAAPPGWRTQGPYAKTSHGHWNYTYVTNAEQSEFGLWVHMHYEDEKCIHGGSAIALSEVTSVFCDSDSNVPSSQWPLKQIVQSAATKPQPPQAGAAKGN